MCLARVNGRIFFSKHEHQQHDRSTDVNPLQDREQHRIAQCTMATTEDETSRDDQTMAIVEVHRMRNRRKSMWVPDEVIAPQTCTGRRRTLGHYESDGEVTDVSDDWTKHGTLACQGSEEALPVWRTSSGQRVWNFRRRATSRDRSPRASTDGTRLMAASSCVCAAAVAGRRYARPTAMWRLCARRLGRDSTSACRRTQSSSGRSARAGGARMRRSHREHHREQRRHVAEGLEQDRRGAAKRSVGLVSLMNKHGICGQDLRNRRPHEWRDVCDARAKLDRHHRQEKIGHDA